MVEELIIKLFCDDRSYYNNYYKYINLNYIKNNFSNIYKLFLIVHQYYEANQSHALSKLDFELAYHSSYLLEDSERNELSDTLDRILALDVNVDNTVGYLNEHKKRCVAGELAKVALDVEDGSADLTDLLDKVKEFEADDITEDAANTVNMDLSELYDTAIATPGLRWRLDWLNKSLGSLRKGDFGFIFARPETGKTTFLASEMTHMVTQTDGDILWFNNEEQGKKVAIRCYQALFGVDSETLFSNVDRYKEEYHDLIGSRIKIYDYEDSSSYKRIESIIKEVNPCIDYL